MKSAPFVVFLKVAAVFDLGIGSGDFSGMVPSREREMGMRSTVLRPMTALGQKLVKDRDRGLALG